MCVLGGGGGWQKGGKGGTIRAMPSQHVKNSKVSRERLTEKSAGGRRERGWRLSLYNTVLQIILDRVQGVI